MTTQNWRPESLHWNPELAEGYRRMNEAFAAVYVEAHRQLAVEFGAMIRKAREERQRS